MTTAENTPQSFMWAKNRGDVTTVFATGTPELAQQQRDLYFKGKSDEEISTMLMESSQMQTGYQILNEMVAAEDQVVFQVRIDNLPERAYTLLTLKQIAGSWTDGDGAASGTRGRTGYLRHRTTGR